MQAYAALLNDKASTNAKSSYDAAARAQAERNRQEAARRASFERKRELEKKAMSTIKELSKIVKKYREISYHGFEDTKWKYDVKSVKVISACVLKLDERTTMYDKKYPWNESPRWVSKGGHVTSFQYDFTQTDDPPHDDKSSEVRLSKELNGYCREIMKLGGL